MIIQVCTAEPMHYHEYPDNWSFGGPTGNDPRMDPRFVPDVYRYLDASLNVVHTTVQFICDDEAVDGFTIIAGYGAPPKWIQVKRSGTDDFVTLPFTYNIETDEVYEANG